MARQITSSTKQKNRGSTIPWLAFIALLLFVAAAPLGLAQVLYGILTGTVTDASGAAVPNAAVTVRNQNNGAIRNLKTNGSGDYTVRDLEPGTYTVNVPAAGSFGGFKQENVAVAVNREVRINATLQAASVNSEVTVTTAPPLLQTETAEVNHQITATELEELPVGGSQGRNFQQLYSLVPGVSPPIEENSTASNPSRSVGVNINGLANTTNTTRIDGAVNTYGWLPYIIAYVPPADAIASVNLVTNSFNAEQGTAGGASINVIIKGGTNQFHGSAWEYNQLFNTNARAYTQTQTAFPRVPKNIFNEYGFSVGGPVYIPHVITGKNKLFFFQDFERITRRQSATGQASVPTTAMLTGDFSAVSGITTLYDPQPGGVGPYLGAASRISFAQEYGMGNVIPASRISPAAAKMLALLQPISAQVGTPTPAMYTAQLANDFNGGSNADYNRDASDTKITYNATDRTNFFGRYSISPDSLTDPQELGAAGGGTFDGGQPGASTGRIQNVGLGASHVFTPNLVMDADFGYTRQRTGAQSTLDIADGDFGTNTLGIPGTNGVGINYVGQPVFAFTGFNSLGNSNGSNPFLFRDNQYTGDVNLSWTKGKHAMRYGAEYYHFALNHFQPTSGSGINNPRGGFQFQGGMTSNNSSNITAYNSLADFELGLPNNGSGLAVAKATQLFDPNALRWSAFAFFAQDQWTITPKLTLNYGARYEFYPMAVRDHEGAFVFDPAAPLSTNVEAGGVNGNPIDSGVNVGWGLIVPRLGIAYRLTDKTVLRTGAGITEDPENFRFLRDTFPVDIAQNYSGSGNNTIAIDPSQNNLPLTLAVGIPATPIPNYSSGFLELPPSQTTTTIPKNFRRGYIESWNLFLEQDLGGSFVANIGYVGTHEVRQITSLDINAGPTPDGTTVCMANGQFNPTSPYYNGVPGTNPCSPLANEVLNVAHCNASSPGGSTCYNTTGVGSAAPTFSAEYSGLQAQLTRNAGRLAQFGLIYTWSHAINFADNSSYAGPQFAYPAYFKYNRASASYNHPNDLQFYFIYHLPFGGNQSLLTHGVASAIFGGLQLNGQISHVSGQPFSVNATSNNINSEGQPLYADLVKPYHQLGGHARTAGSNVTGGNGFFDPTVFANPVEPTYTATESPSQIVAPHFGNTSRNEFSGPGQTNVNLSVFRTFHIFRESEFQVRVEAFNLLNHPQVSICGASTSTVCTVTLPAVSAANANSIGSYGTFGQITSFGNTRTLQYSGRFNF